MEAPASFAIKADIRDTAATRFAFAAQKTMYGGKTVMVGDRIFLFASENAGGSGLFARGVVTASHPELRTAALRQTPRVSIVVERIDRALQPLGRAELRGFREWTDGSAKSELNFKLYRQATDKIAGLTLAATRFLDGLFGG